MPISNKPWGSVSESDYRDAEAFCSACLIDLNERGKGKVKGSRKLPGREPGGALSRNGVHAPAAAPAEARGGVQAPPGEKRTAARELVRMCSELDPEPPDSLRSMSGA